MPHLRFSLTPRQEQIMELVIEGHADKQIAEMLNISIQTVHNLLSSRESGGGAYRRMGIRGATARTGAAVAYLGYRSLKARGLIG